MTKLTVIRHPETTWNKRRLFQGSCEGKITQHGILETQKIVLLTKDKIIDAIYYAGNKRCKYLAQQIANLHPECVTIKDSRLNERSFGKLEGTSEILEASESDFDPSNYLRKFSWRPEGGESLKDVLPKVKEFINVLKIKNVDNTIYVITSGGVMKLILYLSKANSLKEAMSYKAKNLEVLNIVLN